MKKFASRLPDRIKLAMLKQHLAWNIGERWAFPALIALDHGDTTNPLLVSLRKSISGVEIGLNLAAVMDDPAVYRMVYARLPAVLRIFSRADAKIGRIEADLSDGGDTPAGALTFCSARDDVILVPDPVFVNSSGYAEFRHSRSMMPWSQRDDTVLWRGTSTGIGEVTTETMTADNPRLRQRVRMCLILRSVTGTDVRIRKIEAGAAPMDRDRLARYDLIGGKIKQADWGRYKFALDVDGHTNAWSNLFVRLLLGCCVLKIQSEHGFRQWYYDRLTPMRHYVPVRADMSDLIEKIDWCRSHNAECAEIAAAGRAFACAMTVESEIGKAVHRLEAAEAHNFIDGLPRTVSITMSSADGRGGQKQPAGLRIALAIQALDASGGKVLDALAIAAGLTARGHKVTILTRSAKIQIPPDVAVRKTGVIGWSNHSRAKNFAGAIAKARSTQNFEALITFDKLKDADAYYAADVCFAGRAHGIKGWLPRYKTYARLEADCFGVGGPDILFLCRKQMDEYRRYYDLDADRAGILPPMIHDSGERDFYQRRDAVRKSFGIPGSAVLAVSVAVYSRHKGVDRTIAALRDVPGLHLLAVGLNDVESATALAAKYGLGERTHFIGHRSDVADILGAADIMLHPARVENTGLVILESLLAGVPVIASAACGFAEYIERFEAGFVLAEPFDQAAYAAAIRTAIEPNILSNMRGKARDSAPQLRSEGGLERIVDVIEERLCHHLRRGANPAERQLSAERYMPRPSVNRESAG
jgi:glycosyltransferase involved in cell wall biosynthesis